jgi:spore coat protein U-like protein
MSSLKNLIKDCCYSLLVLLAFTQTANAVCAASASTTPSIINIGTYPSQSVPAGGLSSNNNGASASFSVTCSISLTLQLLSTTSWLRYTAQQPLTLSNGTDTISYTIASNATYTPAITASGQSIGGSVGFQLLTLALLASGRMDIPLYIKTLPTSIWPNAGTYTGTQTLLVDGVICTGIGLPGVCLGTNTVNSTVSFSINLIVSKSCEFISTPTLVNFGIVSFIENAGTIFLNASLRCTHLEDYLLYADNGDNYSANSRWLKSSTNNTIAYNVMQPDSPTTPLNSLNPLSRMGTGASESISIPLKITPGQTTPPAGVYTDNLRLVIEY